MNQQLEVKPGMIFVFGSNIEGRHGKGAALYARQVHGAIYGKGFGRQGTSFAIPTRKWSLESGMRTLPLDHIAHFVKLFLEYAAAHPELQFAVTPIGCGLAGYKNWQIAPMFRHAPANCTLPTGWIEYLRHIK